MPEPVKNFCQPLNAAGVETMLAMVEHYEATLAEHLAMEQTISVTRRVPKEIRELWAGRIEFCKELQQRLGEYGTELHLDAMYEPKANGVAVEAKPKGRKKKSVFDWT